MTSRSSKSAVRGFETEIEKCREEGNWKRSVELAHQLKARSTQHESLAHFLIGEGELELSLEQWSGNGGSVAPQSVAAARDWLTKATGEAGRRAGVALDAHLLLAKLEYAVGDTNGAMQHYDQAELSTLTEKELPVRSLCIVAESFAILTLCLEELGLGTEAMRRAAGRASSLGLLWAQRSAKRASPVLQGAMAKALALQGVAGCRAVLTAVEAPTLSALRLVAARRLSELVLRGAGPYSPPGAAGATHSPQGVWQPRRHTQPNQFLPQARQEEALLTALLGEAMAARDAVLSQSPEFAIAREHALKQAVGVVDLLAIAAPRWGLLCLLTEALERAMKFSFGVRHVWRQRALSAAALTLTLGGDDESGVRAAAVGARACLLAPGDVALRLLTAKVCRTHGRYDEAIQWAEEAKALGGPLVARAAGEAGAAWQAKAVHTQCRRERTAADTKALAFLQEAAQLDSADHVSLHRLALQLARSGRLDEALDAVRGCLYARPDCPRGLRLAAALWSTAGAGTRGDRALTAAKLAHDQYPDTTWPLEALGLLLARRQPGAALTAGRALVALAGGTESTMEPDEALSARPSSAGSPNPSTTARPPISPRAMAWLALARLLLWLDRAPAAAGCVSEAAALSPGSHLVFYTRGLVQAAMLDWEAARNSFTDALALQPTHTDSLLQLGGAWLALGWGRLAEASLRSALRSGDSSAVGWRRLSLVLWGLQEPLGAADAASQALLRLPQAATLPLPQPDSDMALL